MIKMKWKLFHEKMVIFYISISQNKIDKYFDTSKIDEINFDKIKRELLPVIKKKEHFDLEGRKSQAKSYINHLMQLNDLEKEYIERFEFKEYRPELLFDDLKIVQRIRYHPMALWKCR